MPVARNLRPRVLESGSPLLLPRYESRWPATEDPAKEASAADQERRSCHPLCESLVFTTQGDSRRRSYFSNTAIQSLSFRHWCPGLYRSVELPFRHTLVARHGSVDEPIYCGAVRCFLVALRSGTGPGQCRARVVSSNPPARRSCVAATGAVGGLTGPSSIGRGLPGQ
jgi:hypothetical protein